MMTNEEIATLAYRAIHTLETLRSSGAVEDDDSVAGLFLLQTHKDMKRLLVEMKERGVKMRALDISAYSDDDDATDAAREKWMLWQWNASEPIRA